MTSAQTDSALIERLQAGDDTAVAELARDYGAKMYQLALRYTRNKEDAEEVVQDVLLKVRDKIDAFRGDAALSSWIYRITFNTAMSRLRATKSTRLHEVPDEPIGTHDDAAPRAHGARRLVEPRRRPGAPAPDARRAARGGGGTAGHLPRAGDPARPARAVDRRGEPPAQGEGPDAEVAAAPRPSHPARPPGGLRRAAWRCTTPAAAY